MNTLPLFKSSNECTIGTELELQLINPHNASLISRAKELIRLIKDNPYSNRIKPEVTQSMIEINSSVHTNPTHLLTELVEINNFLVKKGGEIDIQFSGGGTHPFQMWKNRKIFPTHRFRNMSRQYGYLTKRFTVFGQHIHIGCSNGDDAAYLTQALARYIPQFIALSASSPFYQGIDTTFDSSRANVVLAFPSSGYMPYFKDWAEFGNYYKKLCDLTIIQSIKDIYWDIRPKPEFGTVEIRICDTPLTLKTAVMLTAYAQSLARYLLHEKLIKPIAYDNMLYSYNRYQASRFGFAGNFINPYTSQRCSVGEDILQSLQEMQLHSTYLENQSFMDQIYSCVTSQYNDAKWLRETYTRIKSLKEVVFEQTRIWENNL